MKADTVFKPNENTKRDEEHLKMWKKAVERSLNWLE